MTLEDKMPFSLVIPIDLALGVPATGPGARDVCLLERFAGVCASLAPAPCWWHGVGQQRCSSPPLQVFERNR